MAARRISREFQEFPQRAPPGMTVVQQESGSDVFRAIAADLPAGACAAWILHFTCPPTWRVHGDERPSPYAGLRLSFQIAFPHDYPFKPFSLKSPAGGRARGREDKLYHPVRSEGSAAPLFGGCYAGGRLRDDWSPARTVASVVSETIWLCFSDFERAVPPEAMERFHASLEPAAPAAAAYNAAALPAAAGAEVSTTAPAAAAAEAAGEGERMPAAGAGAGGPLLPPAAAPVTIVIKALTGRVHEIPISPDAPFEELQRLLAVATGCSIGHQRLVRRGAGAVMASRPGQPIRELGLTGCGTVEQPDLHLVLRMMECSGCGLNKPVATLLHRDYAAFYAQAREAALAAGAAADLDGRGEGACEASLRLSSEGAAGGAGAIDAEDATSALRRLRV